MGRLTASQEVTIDDLIEGLGGEVSQVPQEGVSPQQSTLDEAQRAIERARRTSAEAEPPGFFNRNLVQPVQRVGEAAAEGAEAGFGTAPVGPTTPQIDPNVAPLSASMQSVTRGLMTLGELGLRGLSATYFATLNAFSQGLQELGVSQTTARKVMRDAAAAGDTFAFATGGASAVASRGATRTAVAVTLGREEVVSRLATLRREIETSRGEKRAAALEEFRELSTQSKKVEQLRAEERARQAELRRSRQINLARAEAARKAEEAEPGTGIVASAEVDVNLRALDDSEVEAQGLAYIRSPDQILTDVPVFTQEVLNQNALARALEIARDELTQRGIDPTALAPERVFRTVMDLLNTGNLDVGGFKADLFAAGVTERQFIQMLGFTASESGRALNQFRQFREMLRGRALKGDTAASDTLRGMADAAADLAERNARIPRLLPTEVAEPIFRRSSRIFRQLLISLPVTATRNFLDSGGARNILNVANRATDITLRRMFTPDNIDIIDRYDPLGEVGRMFSIRGLIKTKKDLDRLFLAYPEVQNKTFSALEADVAKVRAGAPDASRLDKVEARVFHTLLALNRGQEFLVRRAVFASSLDRRLQTIGSSLREVVDHGVKPAGINRAMAGAMEDALFTTFALNPTGKRPLEKFFRSYAQLVDESRIGPFFEPFARFFFNQAKLIIENTPTGGLRMISKKGRAKALEGNFEPWGREMIGSTLFATALAIRQGEFPGLTPGPRADEVLTSEGNVVSLAPFATIAPFMFLADLTIRIDEGRIQPGDDLFIETFKGLRGTAPQLARFGQSLEDISKAVADVGDRSLEGVSDLGGETAAGFFRPFQLVRDFRAEYNEAVDIQRETRGQGFTAPIMAILDPESLPERESPTRADPPVRPRVGLPTLFGALPETDLAAGLFSQVSGVLVRQPRNAVENEIVKLGFRGKALSPKSGNKRFDALIARTSGVFLEEIGNAVVKSPAYIAMPIKERTEVMRNVINLSREPARMIASFQAPAQALDLRIRRMPGTQREAAFSMINRLLRSGGQVSTAEDVINEIRDLGMRQLQEQGL